MANRIVEFKTDKTRHVRGTRVEVGDTLYAIQDIRSGLYFIWAYTSQEFAKVVSGKVTPGTEVDVAANWRRKTADLVATSRNSM